MSSIGYSFSLNVENLRADAFHDEVDEKDAWEKRDVIPINKADTFFDKVDKGVTKTMLITTNLEVTQQIRESDTNDNQEGRGNLESTAHILVKEKALKDIPIPFYMYDDPKISLEEELAPIRKVWIRYLNEILYDEAIFTVLKRSPLRTLKPEEADVFIPPIPTSRLFSSRARKRFKLVFETLASNEIFRRHCGHNHLLIGTAFALLRTDLPVNALTPYYNIISNMTLVQSWDANGVAKALEEGYDFYEYHDFFNKHYAQPLTSSSISLGLASQPDAITIPLPDYLNFETYQFHPEGLSSKIPLTISSMEKWLNFVFYHTRTEPSEHNSTVYWYAPVINVTFENLPNSIIGWNMGSKDDWIKQYTDSKFCLMIRGDSPHSKAFLRAIRVGCIPVVVADSLEIYALVLKSTLTMSDYAIIIDEKAFVENPETELLRLLERSEADI